jgi:thymidylate synthase
MNQIANKISKADQYFIDILKEVRDHGEWDKNPRPKWSDGTPAHSKFITQKSFEYRVDKGEFPLISLRPTAIAGGWYDMEAIYQKQTNVIEEMHPSIQSWWTPFVVNTVVDGISVRNDIGQTSGHTVNRYDLMNELLRDLQFNPYGRRHVLNLWQKQQMKEDPKALVPCAYETLWSVSENENEVFIDLTLNQRSQDFAVTASINPMQYVMKGLAVCGHLSYHTGREHTLRKFKYNVQNLHIYDRHIFAIEELLQREPSTDHAGVYLLEKKDFYDYRFEDFKVIKHKNIQPLSQVLEIAV